MFKDEKKQKLFDQYYDDFCKENKRTPTTEEFWIIFDVVNKMFKNEDE